MAPATLLLARLAVACALALGAMAQLSPTFYDASCPSLQAIVRAGMAAAVQQEPRMGASILRLFFHDCFVQGCDASVLLDDSPTLTGEKNAGPNANSLRGFEVIDSIKSQVEAACPGTVSCADILALAARDGVNLLSGPTWAVQLGRRDTRTASQSAANSNLPSPSSSAAALVSAFASKGLDSRDLVALSGAHTIGAARCATFRSRVYNDTNISAGFAAKRRQICQAQAGASDGNLAPLDAMSSVRFDNGYFRNLVAQFGLLHSDQELFGAGGGAVDSITAQYARNGAAFSRDFVTAVLKMGSIGPLTGSSGEIRANCRKPN
ncbi:Peroxidase P7 precursor [Zea mays]|uniref:Peroxidase n=1 Tax=Zea mays TaxID=4577 RepID=A0A1D6H658_MAIZE|nr:Peroxidase P7 precursor [Zea mays]AQK70277.1 Peroxidase 52 [Zea mays]